MKHFYLLLMALLMSLSANAARSGTCGDSLKWYLSDDYKLTISGKGKMWQFSYRSPWGMEVKHVIIGDSVTTIGDGAFQMCSSLKEVTIPNSVTFIGSRAFYNCRSLKSVTIPNSVTTIGDGAFQMCSSLKEVTIPNSVTDIGNGAFQECTSLEEVTIPNSVTDIGNGAFQECTSLKEITIPNSVTTIGYEAFYGCNELRSVTIGSNVTSIGSGAFTLGYNRSIPKVIWLTNTPPSEYSNVNGMVHYVANDLYTGLSNTKVYPYLSSIFEVDGIKYVPVSPSDRTCDAIDCIYTGEAYDVKIDNKVNYKGIDLTVNAINPYTAYKCAKIKKANISLNGDIGDEAFYDCDSLESVNIVTANNIGDEAFYDCDSLESVNIVTANNIGDGAFRSCNSLESVNIVTANNIGDGAFSSCNSLSSVTIGKSNNIGGYAFAYCYKLSTVNITKADNIGQYAFQGCSSLAELSLDSKIKTIGNSAFKDCGRLTQFVIPDSVTVLNYQLLRGCSSLKSIKIHKGVQEIGYYVFNGCTGLSTVIMEDRSNPLKIGSNNSSPLFSDCKLDSVYIGGKIVYNTSSSYGYSPFYRNTSLRSVKISDVETTIYDNEFYGCTNLQNVSIGDSVKSIGNWAFSGCNSLSHFDFGSGLQSIGQEAFSDCNNVTEISSEALVPPTCGTNALDDINKWTCKLIVPKASMEAYKQAEQWKEFFFIEENTTGIQAMTSDTEPRSDVYSLTGAKVLDNASLQDVQSLPKGIYVIKGKKIIVK